MWALWMSTVNDDEQDRAGKVTVEMIQSLSSDSLISSLPVESVAFVERMVVKCRECKNMMLLRAL
jgi:hypothetical protein